MFENRKLVIATKHQKESVIAPSFERDLGVHCVLQEGFDTDLLGTFTGEIERKTDPIATVREKCIQAMKMSNCDLGLASEGSFGPHPTMFYLPADDEFLIFIDAHNGLEIIVRELSTSTNYGGTQIRTEKELLEFAKQTGFPRHALILRKSKTENLEIHKGILDEEVLKLTFESLLEKFGSVYVETDMRAMYNPTRMKVIEKAAENLVKKIQSTCPYCKIPGFGITKAKKGLKCDLCGLPTNSIVSYVYQCQHCQFQKEEMYPNQKTTEDPSLCEFCNP